MRDWECRIHIHILHYMAMHGGHARTRGAFLLCIFFILFWENTRGIFYIFVSFAYTLLIVYFWPGREKELYLFDE